MKDKIQDVKANFRAFIATKTGKVAVLGTALASNMAVLASAEETASDGGIAAVSGGITNIGTLMGSIFSMIFGNPILTMFFAAGVIGLVWGIIRKFKKK